MRGPQGPSSLAARHAVAYARPEDGGHAAGVHLPKADDQREPPKVGGISRQEPAIGRAPACASCRLQASCTMGLPRLHHLHLFILMRYIYASTYGALHAQVRTPHVQ